MIMAEGRPTVTVPREQGERAGRGDLLVGAWSWAPNGSPPSSPPALCLMPWSVYLPMYLSGVRCMSARACSVTERGVCVRALCEQSQGCPWLYAGGSLGLGQGH